jgi:hypothetical protein
VRKVENGEGEAARRPVEPENVAPPQSVWGYGRVRLSMQRTNRSAVGKTQVSFTSRRPQQLAPSTLTSLLACTNALRRAILRHGYAWRQPRSDSSLRGSALFPERAPCPSIQSTLKQKLCPSRLRPPRLHPQGRRGPELRPRSFTALRIQHSSEGELDFIAVAERGHWSVAHFVANRCHTPDGMGGGMVSYPALRQATPFV